MERIFGRKTKPVMEIILRFQVQGLEIFVEKEKNLVRVRVVELATGTEAHRKEVTL